MGPPRKSKKKKRNKTERDSKKVSMDAKKSSISASCHILILWPGTTSRSGPRTDPGVARGARQPLAAAKRPAASISFNQIPIVEPANLLQGDNSECRVQTARIRFFKMYSSCRVVTLYILAHFSQFRIYTFPRCVSE